MIRKKLMAQFKSEQWSKHALLNATVQDGTVKLWGIVDSEAEKRRKRPREWRRNRSPAFAPSRTT
jgi:osmotically-inducible protein OsmY